MFQNVDLSSNFYFSYSYDITHTLQYNLTPCNHYDANLLERNILEKFNLNTKMSCVCEKNQTKTAKQFLDSTEEELSGKDEEGRKNEFCFKCNINKEYAIRTKPNYKFVWNEYLLESANIHPDWLIFVIHGYCGQTVIKEFGKELYLTLIARRSKKYAGTRFLKRGTNQDGDVANEVETEQILSEIEQFNFNTGQFSSFVQIRGSIPSHWSQDISKMVPKPQISVDIVDPFAVAAGKHFNQLLARYGSPVIVLSLVKMKEKRPHETLLTNEITRTISYLNQFIPPAYHLQYIGMDMARINKSKNKNVLQNLSLIAYSTLKKVGIFQSFKTEPYSNFNLSKCDELGGLKREDGRILQVGVVRINCVDCLDRTNTAAYMLGKTALAFQLFGMGLISDPLNAEANLVYEKKVCRKLEELYEEHGDVLALQYGGSQLVHRIKTYRKKSHLTSQSRDFMQTISRYYSNTFSDFDKQMAINLFLGAFRAYNTLNYSQYSFLNNSSVSTTAGNANGSNMLGYTHIWEMSTDFYLHNLNTLKRHVFNSSRLYTRWYDEKTFFCLPRACNEVFKGVNGNLLSLVRKRNTLKAAADLANVQSTQLAIKNEIQTLQLLNVSNIANISNGSSQVTTPIATSFPAIADLSVTPNEPAKRLPESQPQSLRKISRRGGSFARYNASSKQNDESTDEYNEHYNCFEYTSFDSMHYFELSRLLMASDRTQHSSSTVDFNPLSMLFSNVRNSLLGTPKMTKEPEDSNRLRSNQSVSSDSSEEEESSLEYEKIHTLNNDSSDFLFSLNLDGEREPLDRARYSRATLEPRSSVESSTPLGPSTAQLRNSTSDSTNLKSLANRRLPSAHFGRRFSFNGPEEVWSKRASTNRCKSIYGQIYCHPNKLDQRAYRDYVVFGNLSGEFNNSLKQEFNLADEDFEFYGRNGRAAVKKNKRLSKSYTSENDLYKGGQKVNFKFNQPATSSNQLSNLLNYNSNEFNQEISDLLEQINLSESTKEDRKLLNNYLDAPIKVKVSSRCKEDYKQYLSHSLFAPNSILKC